MKNKKQLTEFTNDVVQRLIANSVETDEQVENIIGFGSFSKDEKDRIIDYSEMSLEEIIDEVSQNNYRDDVQHLINATRIIMKKDRLENLEFLIKTITTKITSFSSFVSKEKIKELVWPFYNEEKGTKRIGKYYSVIEPDIYSFYKETDWVLFKFLYALRKAEVLYKKCLGITKELSFYIIIGEKKLESVIENDLSRLQNKYLDDDVRLELEEISKQSTILESKIFNLKQYRMQVVKLLKSLFIVWLGTDKLIESMHKSFDKSVMDWRVNTTLAIDVAQDFKTEEGKTTNYSGNSIYARKPWLDVSSLALINPEDAEKVKDLVSKKKAIIEANKELKESLIEYLDICAKKDRQLEALHDKINVIEKLPLKI